MPEKASEKDARNQIAKSFPWCPFCCFKELTLDLESGRAVDFIICGNCGARWETEIADRLKSVKLVSTSVDWKGKDLIGKEMEPEFWQNKAWLCILTRRTPQESS